MKSYASLLVSFLALILLVPACKKNNTSQKGNQKKFPLETVWTGTLHLGNQQYDQPCYLRFNNDQTISIYSLFAFIINGNIEYKDSLTGPVTNISNENGTVNVEADLPDLPIIGGHTTFTIKDNKLACASRDGGFVVLHLELFPDKKISIEGGWSGPGMHGGPLEGRYAYPDLSSIIFDADGTTTYKRNGEIAQIKVPQFGTFTIVKGLYKQQGVMVWMDGYNESTQKTVPYFGVLMASGDKMMVNSRNRIDGRLPSHSATIDWYGPKGVTPIIERQ
jgi:hypothetical protein